MLVDLDLDPIPPAFPLCRKEKGKKISAKKISIVAMSLVQQTKKTPSPSLFFFLGLLHVLEHDVRCVLENIHLQ